MVSSHVMYNTEMPVFIYYGNYITVEKESKQASASPFGDASSADRRRKRLRRQA